MTADEQIRERQARCQQHLARLQMLARAEPEGLSAHLVAAEVGDATNAVLAEIVAAADRAPATGDGRTHRIEPFLGVRLTRLTAAADNAIRAALDEDTAGLRGYLRRFESLVSAIWVVQHALHRRPVPAAPARARQRPVRPASRPAALAQLTQVKQASSAGRTAI